MPESIRGPTPDWLGWTVTGPSPAEGHLPWPGVVLVMTFRVAIFTEPDPQGTQAGSTYTRIRIQL